MTKKFTPWLISRDPSEVGKKFISERGRACEVISCKKEYLDYAAIEGYEDLGALNEWEDNEQGNYYIIKYRDISETSAGKELLEKERAKNKRLEEKKKLRENAEAFVNNCMMNGIHANEEEFSKKYQDEFEKAKHIYENKSINCWSDFLAINKNRLFIAYYNGLDGDDWSYNNYGSYIVVVKDLTKQELEHLHEIIENKYLDA